MYLVRLCIFGKSVALFVDVVSVSLFCWLYFRCLHSMRLCVSFVDRFVWCQFGSGLWGRSLYAERRWRDYPDNARGNCV